MKNLGYEKNLERFEIQKIDKSRCKVFFCLEEKLVVLVLSVTPVELLLELARSVHPLIGL